MAVITNTMEWAQVGIPLVQGVNTGVRARLTEPTTLLIADNVYYPKDGGPEKRLGYDWVDISDPLGIPTNSREYSYGWGANPFGGDLGGTASNFHHGNIGNIKSIIKRDNEIVVQAEESLFNQNKRISSRFHNFSAETRSIAKTQNSQTFSDLADNGIIKVVAFRDLEAGDVKIYCYDSDTNTLKFSASADPNDPEYLNVVAVGEYIHVYISNLADTTLYLHVIYPSDYELRNAIDLGECNINFDTAKVSESNILVLKRNNANGIQGGYLDPDGTTNSNFCSFNTVLDLSATTTTGFACAVHPDLSVGVLWDAGAFQKGRIFDIHLGSPGTIYNLTAYASCVKVAITPRIDKDSAFYYWTDSGTNIVTANSFNELGTIDTNAVIYNVHLCGKAFNIEAAGFVWVCRPSTLQTSYLVINTHVEVVAKLEYGTAVSNTADSWLFSSNVRGRKVRGALLYKRNILDQPGIFHEISTKEYVLDFDFKPRPTQAGRCIYYPGGMVWCYDGERLTEQGFHFTPESSVYTPSNGAGSLTNSGEYYYVIYPCHKNAQGEEVRGPAILSAKVTMGVADDTVTIVGNTIPTLHPNSYFLVYRNANTGTTWHLVSERDPFSANCPKNDTTAATWTFIDTVSDATLASRELDNFTTDNYLLPFSAPSCTILSYGKDRLWAAGGEIPAFQIWPSRLFDQYESPSFHPALAFDIDKSLDAVTAIGFVADYVAVFKRKKGYIIVGDGLDNVLIGNQFQSQLTLTDIGSVSSALCNITGGIVFQSDGSYRVMDPGGKVVDISGPVKDYSSTCYGMYLDIENTSILFYQDNCTLCWNYGSNLWTRWSATNSAVSECEYRAKDNRMFIQGESYTDDGALYEVRIKTAPFQKELGNFQRIRRIYGVGEGRGSFVVNVYLDEKEYPSDTFSITAPSITGTWGDGTWGSGFWGDSTGTGLVITDDRMRWRKRLTTQKCSCISIEVVYNGTEIGPIHTVFAFEYGTKNGLDR